MEFIQNNPMVSVGILVLGYLLVLAIFNWKLTKERERIYENARISEQNHPENTTPKAQVKPHSPKMISSRRHDKAA